MIAAKQTAHLMTRALSSCLALVILNTLLIFLLPPSKAAMAAYHLSGFEYRIISFAIAIPSFLVWFAAFAGYAKLLSYASVIKGTPEGKHFYKLALGAAWLAWSLPLSRIFITVLNSIGNAWSEALPTIIILGNYFSLVLPLIAFTLIGAAAKQLTSGSSLKLNPSITKVLITAFASAGVSYCYFVFKHLGMNSLADSTNGYYLPVWIMLLTVIIPYLYTWFIGLLAACDLALLGSKSSGHLYKSALSYLVSGLVIVLVGSIAIQYCNNIQPRTGYLALNVQLAFTLVFRVVQGLGFALITIGAIKLKKIEEV